MTTLILCVDRDDDLGRKAGVKGPIIGRKNNLDAAVALALADPEDSDANAIFAAVSLYDRMKKEGKDIEVATLTGHENVGIKSDEIIAKQLDKVIRKVKPKNVIFVSDGSEDEYILPLVTSRVPIAHMRKVIVRQSKNIESTYYILMRALKDKKMVKKILVPVALIFLAYAFSSILVATIKYFFPGWNLMGPGTMALTVITLTLGLYFLDRAYSIRRRTAHFVNRIKISMAQAKITIISDTLAFLLLLVGLDLAYNDALAGSDIIIQLIIFLHTFIVWFVFAVLIREGGKTFDIWVHKGTYTKSFWIALLSTVSTGIIIYSTLDYLLVLLNAKSEASLIPITIMVASGIVLAIMAALLQRQLKEEGLIEEPEEERNEVEELDEVV
ncbi:conserved domain protein [Aciduliprofundum boonei T469]|nr:conserved domain protein [Aciduliprofundum boonei T469]